jgi:hypothetical protein
MVYRCTSWLFWRMCAMLMTSVRSKVLLKADMLDYYSVSGCYILKPWSYGIWECIQGKRSWRDSTFTSD